jgi:TetR/AcrR family transcriptional regulator, transcriptional repressor for nem operon
VNARSTRGTETKLRIIRSAADLFHKQGVGATSPDQIIEVSGTGKGQFYHYFKSKEGLVHEVLQTYLDDITKGTAPLDYEVKSWQDLERWFLSNIELQKRFRMTRGCPFGTIGNEVTENDELIRQDLSLIFEVIKNKLAAFFIKEKAHGRLSEDANEDQMADFCIATVQGAMLLGKIKRNSQPAETTVRAALAHLKRFVSSQSAQKKSTAV